MPRKRVFRYGDTGSPTEVLRAAIDSFFWRCEARNLSPCTVKYYRYRFDALLRFLDERGLCPTPAEFTPTLIREFLAYETARVSALTGEHSYVTLKCFFRYLVSEDMLVVNPMDKVERIRLPKKVIETFTTEQVEALLATCKADFTGLRDKAILFILLDCGLRVSELCGLSVPDVDWKDQTLLVLGKGAKERRVPFGKATQRALHSYVARRGDLPGTEALFVTCYAVPVTRQRVHEMIHERAEAAGISNVMCSPHNFRRYFAVSYLRNGGDVFSLQKLLGHTSLEMTRRYAELAQTDIVEKHRLFSPGDALQVAPTGGRQRMR